MEYVYVGEIPRNLASGRPLIFGDTVDGNVLTREDELLASYLVGQPALSAPVKSEAPVPESTTSEA